MTMQTFVVLVIGGGTAHVWAWRRWRSTCSKALGPVFAGTPEGRRPRLHDGSDRWLSARLRLAQGLHGLARSVDPTARRSRCTDRDEPGPLIFVFGATWLTQLMGFEKGLRSSCRSGLATIAKTLLGVVTLPLAWKLISRTR